MDAEAQAAAVLARLERIGSLDSRTAPGQRSSRELLGELRGLLRDADLPVAPPAREEVVERLPTAPHGT